MYIPQDPPLVLHMPTSWQPDCRQSCPHILLQRWGCRDTNSCSQNICESDALPTELYRDGKPRAEETAPEIQNRGTSSPKKGHVWAPKTWKKMLIITCISCAHDLKRPPDGWFKEFSVADLGGTWKNSWVTGLQVHTTDIVSTMGDSGHWTPSPHDWYSQHYGRFWSLDSKSTPQI